ncbi:MULTISPECIES: M48 family metalloprotease [Fusobacterium]|uniref:M48 family metalloprotease n=1 Tax=Fusobacterium TaxID=848 RepID=UPI00147687E8|nr:MULTISPECIES: M48 family metalloprotease [Fusobacterium]NME35586.1 M48 family metalloprotease [Fusobacterium sp. FSA-380-WT-3A]
MKNKININTQKIKTKFEGVDIALIIINIILNIIALFIILLMPLSYVPNGEYLIVILSIFIPIVLTLLGFSTKFQELVGSITIPNQRGLYREEREFLFPIIKNVITRINNEYDLDLNINDYVFKVFIDQSFNAFALGNRNIYVSEGFLYGNLVNEKEMEAILAHEFAHLIKKDTVFLSAVVSCNFIMRCVGYLCTLIIGAGTRVKNKKDASILPILALIFYIIFVKLLSDGLFRLILMFKSRKEEYRCDAFSASLGYTEELKGFFKKLERMEIGSNINFIKILYSTHPKTVDRILALESL